MPDSESRGGGGGMEGELVGGGWGCQHLETLTASAVAPARLGRGCFALQFCSPSEPSHRQNTDLNRGMSRLRPVNLK